ncbi:hypothetical protein V6N12_042582 [Hibiscus sabdariffa]|uniref:Uncharacterized protein n=1 Tax=Hibiscus sabdariffa TaxID=183260 RepID=A0ABR2EGT3_9ROSI
MYICLASIFLAKNLFNCQDAKAHYLDHIIWQRKEKLNLKEYMIQGFCQNQVGCPKLVLGGRKKNNQSDPLEVPGNRLPETGSRRTLPPARGFPARSDQPRQVKEAAVIRSCVDAARTKDRELIQAGNSSTCRSTHLGRRGKIQQGVPSDQHILPTNTGPRMHQIHAQNDLQN